MNLHDKLFIYFFPIALRIFDCQTALKAPVHKKKICSLTVTVVAALGRNVSIIVNTNAEIICSPVRQEWEILLKKTRGSFIIIQGTQSKDKGWREGIKEKDRGGQQEEGCLGLGNSG